MSIRFDTAYTYHFKTESETRFLCIIDGNQGMSLTNNIEHVVSEIVKTEELQFDEFAIIYQDSQGIWDGYDERKQEFIPLSATSERRAIESYLKLHKNAKA